MISVQVGQAHELGDRDGHPPLCAKYTWVHITKGNHGLADESLAYMVPIQVGQARGLGDPDGHRPLVRRQQVGVRHHGLTAFSASTRCSADSPCALLSWKEESGLSSARNNSSYHCQAFGGDSSSSKVQLVTATSGLSTLWCFTGFECCN